MKASVLTLQQRLQYTFAEPALLQRALTHRSYSADHYERLEFLGDSVLGMCVSDLLYERLQSLPEGDLSRVRANLVRQDTLHRLALKMGVPEVVRLGEGEMRSGGQKRPSILADVLEALIGAVYLDGGYAQARALVRRLYEGLEINPAMDAIGKDPKTELQEWLQSRRLALPVYTVVATRGASHQQSFEVACAVAQLELVERGQGTSRRAGEQAAAAAMLQKIKSQGTP